jgi:hypothetical protein
MYHAFTPEEFHLTKADEPTSSLNSHLLSVSTSPPTPFVHGPSCTNPIPDPIDARSERRQCVRDASNRSAQSPYPLLSLNRSGTWEQGIWEEARVERVAGAFARPPPTSASWGPSPGHVRRREVALREAGSASPPTTSAMRPVAGGSAMTPPRSTWGRVAGSVAPGRRRIRHLAANKHES